MLLVSLAQHKSYYTICTVEILYRNHNGDLYRVVTPLNPRYKNLLYRGLSVHITFRTASSIQNPCHTPPPTNPPSPRPPPSSLLTSTAGEQRRPPPHPVHEENRKQKADSFGHAHPHCGCQKTPLALNARRSEDEGGVVYGGIQTDALGEVEGDGGWAH